VARFVEAISLRDADALPMLLTADSEVIDHLNGFTYGGPRQLEHYRRLIRTQGLSYQYDPLATLGDCLALFRVSISGSGAAGRTFDVGAFDSEQVVLVEVDVHGRRRRQEIFAASRLGDALARLSERYAELLPEGAARARAAAIARSAAMMAGPHDLDRYAAALAPDLEFVDHRLLGLQSVLGREALLRWLGSLVETADDLATHVDDILALESDRALVRRTTTGRLRASGGPFETQTLQIVAAGADGLAARIEWFDLDRLDEALARFDELTFEPPPARPVRRRILPNAATAHAARLDAAIAARDTDALPALFAEDAVSKDHKTGLAWDRSGILFSLRALVGAESPKSRLEPVATLGDALALMRWTTSASAFAGGRFDVGAYEREEIALLEVDGQGRRRRSDLFPSDRLGDAVAHLYERHAELLPEGPERTRATANARTIAVYSGPIDVERWVAAWSRDVEYVDRRTLGAGSATGIAAFRVVLESLLETASDMTQRFDDVLALRPDAWLLRNTNFGTDRSTGGAYERPYLLLMVTGADGLVTRIEQFDVDRDAEALARFVEVECARELEDEEPEPPPANRGR
jgi:ketosteroid isomerase-like protein